MNGTAQIRSDQALEAAVAASSIAAATLDEDQLQKNRQRRVDVYLFFSFDLVGSTQLKSERSLKFHWSDFIQYFYGKCKSLISSLEVDGAVVWKYIGDEILMYQRVTDLAVVPETVEAIYRVLDTFVRDLDNTNYAEAAQHISIKGIAWLAPVLSYSTDVPAAMAAIIAEINAGRLSIDDRMIQQDGFVDFLGPNIDAGFRLATFARRLQLVVSPTLAALIAHGNPTSTLLKIVGFSRLKGVANDALYPGIWYRKSWLNLDACFGYEELHSDPIVHDSCFGSNIPLSTLDQVSTRLSGSGHFTDRIVLERIVAAGRDR